MTVLANLLRIASVALSLALPLPALSQQAADTVAPEAATTTAPKGRLPRSRPVRDHAMASRR